MTRKWAIVALAAIIGGEAGWIVADREHIAGMKAELVDATQALSFTRKEMEKYLLEFSQCDATLQSYKWEEEKGKGRQ